MSIKRLIALIAAAALVGLVPVCACAQTELIENGDFSAADGGLPRAWHEEAWLSGPEDYLIEARDGAAYINNFTENDARLCQTVAVEPNTYYRLSCTISTAGVSGGAGANISAVGSLATSAALTGDNEGVYTELCGRTGSEQESLTVCVRVGGYGALSSGEAWFDDFSLVRLDSRPSGDVADFAPAQSGGSAAQSAAESAPSSLTGIILATLMAGALTFLAYRHVSSEERPGLAAPDGKRINAALIAMLALAFAARVVFSTVYYGHPTDINCFMAWGNALVENGFSSFYTSGMFADYPPGYMYVLYLTSGLAKLLGISYGSGAYAFMTKLPSVFADLAAAYIVFRMARRRFSERRSFMISMLVAFSPVMMFVSGAWGQIDQILSLLLLTVIYLFICDKKILAGLVYGIAVSVKPQALMLGPLLAVAYIAYIKDSGKKGFVKTVIAVVSALALIFLISLPFRGGQGAFWVIDKYLSTATSYAYASVEAFNLFALFGGNWAGVDGSFLFLTYRIWGIVLMAAAIAFAAVMYIKGRKENPHCLTLTAAFLLAALFTLGHYMHERYLFPALLLMMTAYLSYGDRRILAAFSALSVSLLLNILCAFMIVGDQGARDAAYNALVTVGSLLNVAGFAYFAYVTADITMGNGARTEPLPRAERAAALALPQTGHESGEGFTKRDRLCCIAVTAVYAVVALLNLGTTEAPQTAWRAESGESVTIELERETELSAVRVFCGLDEGTFKIEFDDGTTAVFDEENGNMFSWVDIEGAEGAVTKRATLSATYGKLWINELAFFDADGNYVSAAASTGAEALVDEPDEVPDEPSYLNGMYFDEIYHARTAYEHLNGIQPYENSHPPLGKVFIMLGVAIFGMNAFGWRIIGTLFGIAMVPLMYAFAKRLLRRTDLALLAAGLFAFDFMHFTQTRIATIDVYGVFFIILMYYFMYRYYCMDFMRDGVKKTLVPLALSGLCFALGTACKWICIYAGVGLAVIFFTSLIRRCRQYAACRKSDDASLRAMAEGLEKNAMLTVCWCAAFFVLLPVVVYLLSYIPYFLCESRYDLEGVWGVQEFMFSYHSTLEATHPYQSAWWEWPLILRPIWYYVGYNADMAGYASTISAFGNPAVWWGCLAGTGTLAALLLTRRIKADRGIFVLLVGLGANFLPWVLVPRCTFIYHYFATVPFIVLLSMYAVAYIESKRPRLAELKWAWLCAAIVLFALFYPVISGLRAPVWYVRLLEWLPGWTFLGV